MQAARSSAAQDLSAETFLCAHKRCKSRTGTGLSSQICVTSFGKTSGCHSCGTGSYRRRQPRAANPSQADLPFKFPSIAAKNTHQRDAGTFLCVHKRSAPRPHGKSNIDMTRCETADGSRTARAKRLRFLASPYVVRAGRKNRADYSAPTSTHSGSVSEITSSCALEVTLNQDLLP